MSFWVILLDVLILLCAALVFGAAAARLRQSPLIGYIAAGMLVGGPGSLQLIESQTEIEAVAELGVTLLLFSLGLEFAWSKVKMLGSPLLLAGIFQVLITLIVGSVALLLFDFSLAQSAAIGAIGSISSTACVLRVLVDRQEMDSASGRNALGILLVQDAAVVPLAIFIGALVSGGGATEMSAQMGKSLLLVTGMVAGLYLVVNYFIVHLLGAFAVERNRELSVLLAMIVGLGSSLAAHNIGVSPALGAFVAGMLLGSSPFATQVRSDISALRVVLLTLFFGAAGMLADPLWIIDHWAVVLLGVGAIIVSKVAITAGLLAIIGQPLSIAFATAISLAQIGEFAFVLGDIAYDGGLLKEDVLQFVVSCVIVSLLLTPKMVANAPRWGRRLAELCRQDGVAHLDQDNDTREKVDAVVFGFGSPGQLAAQELAGSGKQVMIVDLNRNIIQQAKAMGFSAAVGDATSEALLEHARVRDARLFIVTVPNRDTAAEIIRNIRCIDCGAKIISRARFERDKEALLEAGAHEVVGDEQSVGEAIRSTLRGVLNSLEQDAH